MLTMNNFDTQNLRHWFIAERRDLPWRQNISPYAVWVSEVMLQQTQVAVVIPYFERWMQQFPTVAALAAAPLDQVIKAWEGLGYYSRARNLNAGAKQVMDEFAGILPSDEVNLQKIKGLGPYTVGAIRAFAFKQKAVAVDGNVLRVMSRFAGIEADICKPKTVAHIRELTLHSLPEYEPWVISEALIELGAKICGRQPKCLKCPLKANCKALATGMTTTLPIKSSKVKSTTLYRAVAVIISVKGCLVRRGNEGEIMSDLHEFSYFEMGSNVLNQQELENHVEQELQLKIDFRSELEKVRHGFTRYDVHLTPALFICEEPRDVEGYLWKSFADLDQLAFSSGHRRIYQAVKLICQAPGIIAAVE